MDDVKALSTIVAILKQLEPDAQSRVLTSVQAFLGVALDRSGQAVLREDSAAPLPEGLAFSLDRTLSPKDFLRDKHPMTDVERVACLAYYLAHYRDTPHFKTVDISVLNTEAAQPKFSNASVAVDNARQAGLLVPATKGNKQISAAGEKFVELLPDRDAAREALRNYRPRRNAKRSRT
jgi:hypothetical protein